MPVPFILGAIAAVAGVTGVGAGAYGAKKMYDANETMKSAKSLYDASIKSLENEQEKTCQVMDKLGYFELEILKSFDNFSNLLEKIQNKPEFKEIQIGNYTIPEFTPEKLKEVSIGAATILTSITGLGTGIAGGIAASGATTAAVMSLAAASTGTAISSLSGAAATNATLAFLGGGALSAGGGGMALGATILSASTLGVGLLVGGAITALSGSKMTDKADKAYEQAYKVKEESEKISIRLKEIANVGSIFYNSLEKINTIYISYVDHLNNIINKENKIDWLNYTNEEKKIVETTILLVGVLYNMCKVKLTIDDGNDSNIKKVNSSEIDLAISNAEDAFNAVIGL